LKFGWFKFWNPQGINKSVTGLFLCLHFIFIIIIIIIIVVEPGCVPQNRA